MYIVDGMQQCQLVHYLYMYIVHYPSTKPYCNNTCYCSSLSIYIHNLENLDDISSDEHQALDVFIDQLYEEMDKGENYCQTLANSYNKLTRSSHSMPYDG